MKKVMFLLLASLLFTLVGISSVLAQEATESQKAPAATEQAAPSKASSAVLGAAETISGTITMVVPEKDLLVVTNSSGIPFNFVVGRRARITVNGKNVKLADLTSEINKSASVHFVPTRSGNVARSVEVGG
jgi:hypothetical protein